MYLKYAKIETTLKTPKNCRETEEKISSLHIQALTQNKSRLELCVVLEFQKKCSASRAYVLKVYG
jgi:hypothetical protein